MKNKTKERILEFIYFPGYLIVGIIMSPLFILEYAVNSARDQAFDDVYVNEQNPMINPVGPSMLYKKRYCWIIRFLGLGKSPETLYGEYLESHKNEQ